MKNEWSNVLLADYIDVYFAIVSAQQILQLLFYLLSLLLVAQTLENVHGSLQINPRISDLQADVDCSQQFQRPGQLNGLTKHFLF